jgi:hypothetical protein
MIPIPTDWKLSFSAHALVFVHPDGKQVATLHYRERVQPLRRVGAILDEILARTPGFAVSRVDPPERLCTLEGEHAVLVTVAGVQDGVAAQRDVGIVFGDDFFAALVGLCLVPDHRDELTRLVRVLTRHDQQLLGVRRRRFEYTPPPGWQALARERLVEWYPPEFPRDPSGTKIHPAYPRAAAADGATPALLSSAHRDRGLVVEEQPAPTPVSTRAGLGGQAHVFHIAPDVTKEIVVLDDARYRYILELSTRAPERWAAHHATLGEVVASVVPIPTSQRREIPPDMLAYWST